ncbi:MAG: lysylphosphatidylglycerol synthase domain-containing protein [Janthinobacterium lividum]
MRSVIFILTLVGLAGAAAIVGSIGVAPVLAAVRAIGVGGYVAYCLYTVVVLGLLGVAWRAVAPDGGALRDYVWARTVREAATDVLPFSQIGGLIVGGRVLTARGVSGALAYASMTADLTTEMASQAVFTLFGVGLLALLLGGALDGGGVLLLALGGLGLTLVLLLAFTLGQQPMLALAARLGERLLPASVASLRGVHDTLAAIYRNRPGLLLSFAANLAAWLASGTGAWLALQLMGVDIGLVAVLAIESLIFTVRSVAFVVPGALGVQEGAYLLVAPLFGLDPQTAVALSLLKRARDLTIGVPALLVWQTLEGRRLLA